MPKLDKLIRELCSEGVQVFRLEEIAHYAKTRIDCKTINEDNYVGVENLLQNKAGKTKATSVPTTGMVIAYQKNDILIGNIRPYLRKVWLADCEGGTNGDVLTVQIEDTEKVLPQFLYYVLSSEKFFLYDIQNSKGAKMPRGSKDAVMKFEVPLPHLDVQREIVRMLDSYTESVVELQRQLTAELTARKTQYAYYRDKLLQYKMPTKEYEVGEICEVSAGGDVPKEHFSKEKSEQYKVPVISNGCGINAFYGYTDAARVDKPAVTVAARGTIGYAEYRDYPYFPIIRLITLIPRDDKQLNAKYLYYSLEGRHYKVPTSGIPQLTVPVIKKEKVSIPPLDVQNRIVNVLDNFEKICSDLNIGLPAEIEARQKQYEYYRDKLLTFAETGNTILSRAEQSRALIKLLQYVFGYVRIPLGDIGSICMCKRILKSQTNTVSGVPFYKIGTFGKEADAYISQETFDEYRSRYNFPKKGDVLISAAGTIGRTVVYNGEPAYFQDSNIVWIDNDESIVLNSYLRFCYELKPWKASEGGTIPRLYNDNIAKAVIAVPSIEEQKRIVSILDRFDIICNDLTSGLPAEIEARQKQYKYYKDKLLSFKEKE